MRKLYVTLDIPDKIHVEIGKIMVLHAWIEWRLSAIIHHILGVNPKQGRLAVKEGRTHERIGVIEDLLMLKKIAVKSKLGTLKQTIQELTGKRDRLAHGIWARLPIKRGLYLRITRGEWPKDKKGGPKKKRIIAPQAERYTARKAAILRRKLERYVAALAKLSGEVERALITQPPKQHAPIAKQGRPQGRGAAKPPPPPQSSAQLSLPLGQVT